MSLKKKTVLVLSCVAVLAMYVFRNKLYKMENTSSNENVVNVYSARNYDFDKVLYEAFEKKTGIKVHLINGKASELLEDLIRDGKNTDADLFLTSDIANLNQAIEAGLNQPIESKMINKNIPKGLRGKKNHWVGITLRARAIAYDKEKINEDELSTFEELAHEKWRGKILTRSSDSLYTKSLLGSIIESRGEEEGKKWAQGVVNNFARDPEGNDKTQIRSISSKEGSIGIVSTHYFGNMLNSEDAKEREASNNVGLYIPKDTSINVSGAVLSKYSKNKENAIKLLEFLTDVKAQQTITEVNFEYPVNPKVRANKILLSWGEIEYKNMNLEEIDKYNKKADEIFKEVGWN